MRIAISMLLGLSLLIGCASHSSDTTPVVSPPATTYEADYSMICGEPISPCAHVMGANPSVVAFQPGTYPFNVDISGETATGVFNCEGHCTGQSLSYTQSYPLHVDNNTPNELEPVACSDCSSHPVIPNQPFSPYTTLYQITGSSNDHPFEAVDPTNELAYEVYQVSGTPPANTAAYSGCVDTMNATTPQNTNYGPCNGESGWHDNALVGGLAPEEVNGTWAQPNPDPSQYSGTVNHGVVLQEPNCGGYCGSAPQCVRLNSSKVSEPTDYEAAAFYWGLTHYCSWTTDGGDTFGFSRLFKPIGTDANFDLKFYQFIESLTANDFDVMPCAFENNGTPPSC